MKTKINFLMLPVLFVGVTACSSSEPAARGEIDEAQARSKASAAAPNSTIGSVTKLDEGDEHRWKVEVTLANGAPLTIEIERATGVLAEIEGERGPFDYDLPAPASGFLTYGQAKAKALAAKTGDVELWEVKTDRTQYEFYVRETATARLYEIKLEATKGDVTSIEQKDKPD